MNMEAWKDVVGYEGVYKVSSCGRVMRVAQGQGAHPGRVLKPQRHARGYLHLALSRDGKSTNVSIHRLVAEAFLGRAPSSEHQVNHKNGNKADNRVENLDWVTCSENHRHAYGVLGRKGIGPVGEASGSSKLTRKQVKEIRRLYVMGEYSQRYLGEMFKISRTAIGRIVRRECWQHVM